MASASSRSSYIRLAVVAAATTSAVIALAPARAVATPAHTATSAAAISAPTAAAPTPGSYNALTPARLLDTRTGNGATKAPLAAHATLTLQVAGRGDVPPTGASAVALNVTVTGPTQGGNLTVYPYGSVRPTASNLNFSPGQTVPNLVLATLGQGKILLTNNSTGTLNLVADVSGYYATGTATASGSYTALTPYRAMDTRIGTGVRTGAVPAHGSVTLTVATGGTGHVPATGAGAVALNVTATAATAGGNITVYPTGTTQPLASNLNYAAAKSVPNLVVTKLGTAGQVTFTNNSTGTVGLVADVGGYFRTGAPIHGGTLGAFAPTRVLDTRIGLGAAKRQVPAHGTILVKATGVGGVTPVSGISAVIVNVTVTGASASGNLTVYPAGRAEPSTSSLNYPKATSIPNLVIAGIGTGGQVAITNNSAAAISVIADLSGYVLGADLAVPPASPGYYVRRINGDASHDTGIMGNQGYGDALNLTATDTTPRVVVLDFGAQTLHDMAVNGQVALTGTSPVVRISYAGVVNAVRGYINGWDDAVQAAGIPGVNVTVVVATNSDGDWTGYTPDNRARDWWMKVVKPSQSGVPSNFTVVGGSDVEAGFAASAAQVEQWITAYTDQADQPLVEIGSADACPDTPNTVATTCQPVASDNAAGVQTWSQEDYYQIAHGAAPGHIQVLPQIYVPGQAVQWENISLTGQKNHLTTLTFIGSLTEFSADPTGGQNFDQGWANLFRQLSTSSETATALPNATDLGVV